MPPGIVPEDVSVHAPELAAIPVEVLAEGLEETRAQLLRMDRICEHPRHHKLCVKSLLRVRHLKRELDRRIAADIVLSDAEPPRAEPE